MSWIINFIKNIFGVKEEKDDSYSSNEIEETVDFNKMNKKELEKYGRTLGIELDRRWSKPRLIDQVNTAQQRMRAE